MNPIRTLLSKNKQETTAKRRIKQEYTAGLVGFSKVASDVQRWLEANENWLFIYDNADDPDLLEPYRPRNTRGHIPLTSRAHRFKGHLGIVDPIKLRSLHPPDAEAFLFRRTNRKQEKASASERQAGDEI